MFEGKERRKSTRRKKDIVIKFSFENRGNEIGHGITANISESGLAVYTVSAIKKGESLSIEPNPFIPFETAIVRWTKTINGICLAGMERTVLRAVSPHSPGS